MADNRQALHGTGRLDHAFADNRQGTWGTRPLDRAFADNRQDLHGTRPLDHAFADNRQGLHGSRPLDHAFADNRPGFPLANLRVPANDTPNGAITAEGNNPMQISWQARLGNVKRPDERQL
jgi:hypothetical protein